MVSLSKSKSKSEISDDNSLYKKSDISKEKIKSIIKIFILIAICVIVYFVYNKTIQFVNEFPDSSSYLNFNENIFLGKVNNFRTPVYPYFIKIIRFIFGEVNLLRNIVIIQYIIYIFSVVVFYKICKLVFKNKIVSYISALFYGANPYLFLWNNTILTESLSIVSMVILIYYTILYLKEPRKSLAIITNLHILFMCLLRPGYIYIIPIYLAFFVIKMFYDKEKRKTHIISVISNFITILLIIFYCFLVKLNTGDFNISIVSKINKIAMIINSNISLETENKEINEFVINTNEDSALLKSRLIIDNFTTKDISTFTSTVIKNDLIGFTKYLVKNSLDFLTYDSGTKYVNQHGNINGHIYKIILAIENNIFNIKMGVIFLMNFIIVVFLIYTIIRKRKIPYIITYFTIMQIAGFLLIILGSPGEFSRLFVATLPFTFLTIFYIIDIVIRDIKFNNVVENAYEISVD